jgi:two-component sensor histidine kinase
MALIATQVGAYPLAGKILANLTRRAWISNDPNTYDYLNHYYLTRSRIDVFYRHRPSPYIDSLEQVFRRSRNLMDSLYYAENLGVLLGKNRDYSNAYRYWQIERQLTQRLNHAGALVQMQHALLNSELLAEKNKLAYQTAMRETRWQAVWVMGALLIIITWLSAYLYRRNRQFKAQSDRLAVLNQQLDEQVDQVQLLNKEIQHRVKNNLQMIYSLLHMQERKTANPDVLAQLQQARLRVESIATLHNQLIETNGPIDLTLYINSMIDSVVRCYDKVVTTQLDFGPLLLPANYYLPLALILTEWVTNSLKHAVPAGDELCIQIKLQSDPGKLCVAYADNGLVVSASPVPNLGMDIVRLLSRQISGVLTSPPDNPYRYQLCLAHD